MALPKLDLPLFETKLPSTDETVTYRAFTVKEEKLLLIAQESNDPSQMVLSMKQIINNCCSDIVVEDLAMFDLEYLLLQIRARSIDNNIAFTIKDQDTDKTVDLELDIDEIKLHIPENHSKKIDVTEDIYFMMRYPTIEEVGIFLNFAGQAEQTEEAASKNLQDFTTALFDVMINCIDVLVNGDEVQKMSDFTKKEIMDFIESAPGGTIDNLRKFFDSIPSLRYEVKYTNANGDEKSVVLEGTETFFL